MGEEVLSQREKKDTGYLGTTGDFPFEMRTIHHIVPKRWGELDEIPLWDGRVVAFPKEMVARTDFQVAIGPMRHAYCHRWLAEIAGRRFIINEQRWAESQMLALLSINERWGYRLIVSQYNRDNPWFDPFWGKVDLEKLVVRTAFRGRRPGQSVV